MKELLKLFFVMFKIGLFTFGGGYAMIAILEDEFVSRKKWVEHEEFMDLIAIAESTPGPIAINSATYLGYKTKGVLGSVFATLGVVLPSFIIIFIISLFFDAFLGIAAVYAAFRGIQIAVIFLIASAGIKMLKKMKKTPFNLTLFGITATLILLLTFLSVDFSSILLILAGAVVGLVAFLLHSIKKKSETGCEK